MEKIIWTSESERWLKEIYEYISEDNQEAAIKVVEGIYNKAQVLLEHPKIGYIYEHEVQEEIRILLYGHYRITYLINKDKDIVVLGVFHGALKIESYLRE